MNTVQVTKSGRPCHPERSAAGAKSRDRYQPYFQLSLDYGSLREPALGMTAIILTEGA